MANSSIRNISLSRRTKIWGTLFLIFQIVFAINSYGPHRIVGLHWIFDEPWVVPHQRAAQLGTSAITFEDATARSGLGAFRRAPFHAEAPRYLEVMGGGVAVGDYDGDGWEDVFLTSLPAFGDDTPDGTPSTLFRNRGDGSFEDVTADVGLDAVAPFPQGALFWDADNDGDQDLYVATYGSGQFFENRSGTFVETTASVGLDLTGKCGALPCFGSSATAADYNRDGHLDLLVITNVDWDVDDPDHRGSRKLFPAFFEAQPAFLFRNNGDGMFTEVTQETGLQNVEGKGLSAVWFDVNNDQWPDLYIANDLTRNTLYFNNGDGTFREFAAGAGVDEIKSSMGVAAGDVDHDGHLDLATTNLQGSMVSLFHNRGDLRFSYATNRAGLTSSRRISGWGLAFADLDLDGHLDLAAAGGPLWDGEAEEAQNLIFRNQGDGTFADVTASSGPFANDVTARGLAVFDADRSGTPDLLFAPADSAAPQLLLNRTEDSHRWLKVRLEGTDSNRDGVGARVFVQRADSLRMMREVRAGGSYQSAHSKTLTFGLGASRATEVIIQWPAGTVDTLRQVPVNQTLHVTEGEPDHSLRRNAAESEL